MRDARWCAGKGQPKERLRILRRRSKTQGAESWASGVWAECGSQGVGERPVFGTERSQ